MFHDIIAKELLLWNASPELLLSSEKLREISGKHPPLLDKFQVSVCRKLVQDFSFFEQIMKLNDKFLFDALQ